MLSRFDTDRGQQLLSSLLTCIEDNGMWKKIREGVLLGFSGGPDSVFLALAFLYLKLRREDFPLALCHVHHGIRKVGADFDLAFSVEFAKSNGLELFSSHIDVPALAKEQGVGIEECARNVRYFEFQKIITGRNDLSCIATAHNATDNLETVIQRLMRGTGSRGLCGIAPVRDNIIRPMLYIPKKNIVDFLRANDISYVIDETNSDIHYTRNFIRNEILPDLEKITPTPEVSIIRFLQNLREDQSYLDGLAHDFISQQNLPFVSVCDFRALPRAIQYRVLNAMIKPVSCDFMLQKNHIDLIFEAVENQKRTRISLGKKLYFVIQQEKIYFETSDVLQSQVEKLSLNTPYYSTYFEAYFLFCDDEHFKTYKNVYKNSISVSLSSAIINGELYLRGRHPKDLYRVKGMTRKIKTLFQSLHLPDAKTNKIPIICDDKGILYVPPFGVREEKEQILSSIKYHLIISYMDDKIMPWHD